IKVMLIDDHPVVRAGLRAILDSFDDIEVVAEGSSGKDVERLFAPESLAVDVVVCDIQMPGMDGISATRRVRDAGGPPVLILTTWETGAAIIAAVEAGQLGDWLKTPPSKCFTMPSWPPLKAAAPFRRKSQGFWLSGWAGRSNRCRRARLKSCRRSRPARRISSWRSRCLSPKQR